MTGEQLFNEWVRASLCFDVAYTWDMLGAWNKARWNDLAQTVTEKVIAADQAALRSAMQQNPRCSICKDNPNECSKNYSGGWVGTKCPN